MRFFHVLLFVIGFTLPVAAQSHSSGNAWLKSSFRKAEKEFAAFEREHGAFIQTENVKMHYLRWGEPANPPLIWSHGSMNSGYEVMHIAEGLAKAGFYVLAIDYYGHGQTPIPDGEVSLYNIADDIRVLMDHLSIDRAFIGGFSRGGYVATAFFDAYPGRVLGLILEDGGSVAANTHYHKLTVEKLTDVSLNFITSESDPWNKVFQTKFDAYKALHEIDGDDTDFSVLSLIQRKSDGEWSVVYHGMMALFHLDSPECFMDLVLRPSVVPLFARSMVMMEPAVIFRNLHVPVLILDPVSVDDPMPFEKENRALKELHPDLIKHILYEDTGHNIHYEHPERFTRDVIHFMRDVLSD